MTYQYEILFSLLLPDTNGYFKMFLHVEVKRACEGPRMVSTTTEYALRALVRMTRLPGESWILGRDLAEKASVPANYLSKILLTLRNAEIVETTRGHGGGYRLAKPASEIALIDVASLFEGIGNRPGCILGEAHECGDEHGCSAHSRWKHVLTMYLDFLETTTIADVS